MGRCRVYARPDGSVVVTRCDYSQKQFVRGGETKEEFYARLFGLAQEKGESPKGVPFVECDDAAVPWHTKALGFRAAWSVAPTGCRVDMPKARIIRMDHIRVERNRRLDEIDKVINTKVDSGLDVTALRVVRQKLRDIPQTTDLTVATTPEALAALEPSWPANP